MIMTSISAELADFMENYNELGAPLCWRNTSRTEE